MKIFANKDTKLFFCAISLCMAVFWLVSQLMVGARYQELSIGLLIVFGVMVCLVLLICFGYFYRQNQMIESAVAKIDDFLCGDTDARIDCDEEGELYKLFHSINTLATVLNAHAKNENRSKEFLKNTISDISHQLKTPLAALNIYNGLLQSEAEGLPQIKEFVSLSEQELDRTDALVQKLLKITKLDAGTMLMQKAPENITDMMNDLALHFAYRTRQEEKELILSGAEDMELLCDREWLTEAFGNIIKNALDHMKEGDSVIVEWGQFGSITQISIKDNGSGIHQEDIHHIFKRFYRSRFSKDVQGVGLGLPIAKAVIEAHDGTIEVDSMLGVGTSFVINFRTRADTI